ncbi:LysR family transcriptional regulator [Paraburkholderia sp. BCC1884]|uniref:LysR family transcriptional regulator n=1 Tax=Paraburkholderia sp. BCC1884 TaxID=2562668 RepID=UPI001184394B|nr:LysR family transcriptional regulator [Paraburkholderia sp. BCC1884]
MDAPTLDRFVVFIAVADCGGFAAAARKLGRAQSAMTYAIRALEEDAGLLLFDRTGYRAILTDAGRALLTHARRITMDVDEYRRIAKGFAKGLEANLTLVVDDMVPIGPVVRVLSGLHKAYPSVHVRLKVEPYQRALELMVNGQANLGILVQATAFGSALQSFSWTEYSMVPVASPTHPLVTLPRPIASDALHGHMQVVWTPSTATVDSRDYGVHSLHCWHVTDMRAKRELLRAGVGWGTLPDYLAANDLEEKRLVKLELRDWEGHDRMPAYATAIVRRKEAVEGPAARWLLDEFKRSAQLHLGARDSRYTAAPHFQWNQTGH